MKKRGQVFSADMVIGFVIFLFIIGFFYNYMTSIQAKKFKDVTLEFQSDFVFDSIMLGLDKYMNQIPNPPHPHDVDFFGNNSYRIIVDKLNNFKIKLDYCKNSFGPFCDGNSSKTIVLGSLLDSPNFKNMSFCMYFMNKSDVIMHIGPKKDIYINKTNNILCGTSPDIIANPKPYCTTPPYTHSTKVSRPVVWDVDSGPDEIVIMHILICGEQIE